MASAASLRDALARLAETLIIGAAGGAVLGLAHFPAGWLSGAIIAVGLPCMAMNNIPTPGLSRMLPRLLNMPFPS
jgi:uncharacterized membrane protein AbrB (regulator of aidB expression)